LGRPAAQRSIACIGQKTSSRKYPLPDRKRENRLRAALPEVPPTSAGDGYLPTKAQRIASADPHLSLQERYGSQQGCVDAVSAAAEDLAADRLLLPADADNIVAAARASNVLQ